MSSTFTIKRGDTSPSLLYALSPASVILTGASVVFNMRAADGTPKIARKAAVVQTATGQPTVRYDWVAADTDVAGMFQAEFEIAYTDGTIETFPSDDFILVKITGDIA